MKWTSGLFPAQDGWSGVYGVSCLVSSVWLGTSLYLGFQCISMSVCEQRVDSESWLLHLIKK